MADSAKMVPTAFSQMAGVGEEKPRSGENPNIDISKSNASRLTPSEFQSVIKNMYVSKKEIPNSNLTNAEGLISYFLPIHEQIGQVLYDTEKMKKLAPEIDQAKLIRISSIMSPNDLQEGSFKVSLDEIPGITQDAKAEIIKTIEDYFNKTEELGKKAAIWAEQSYYGPGCAPILVLPSSIQQAMREDGLVVTGTVVGNSKLDLSIPLNRHKSKMEILDELCDKSIYSLDPGVESWNAPYISAKRHDGIQFKSAENDPRFEKFIEDICYGIPLDPTITDVKTRMEKFKELKCAVEQMTVRFVKTIEEGDVIKLTENPEIIKFATEYRKKTKQVLSQQIDQHLQRRMNYKVDEMVSLSKYEDTDKEDLSAPLLLELPAESVIPICVPGNEREHLGYFILLDEMGQPLKANESSTERTYGWGGSIQAAYDAMYSANDKNIMQVASLKNYEEQTVRRVFDGLMDQFLKARLKGIGLDDVSIQKSNAIVTTMLYRMFESKRTRILFVPTSLMTYFCFNYRPNGTGKSLLEDIHYLLSLRVTFQVAALMGMSKDAINHRTLNVTFDEKETNPLALMEQLTNMFVEKERMPFSMNPDEISRGIARNAISISPNNLPGLSDFKIERVNDGGGGGNKPDTELLDTLTNMLITALGVPYSALNQLGEQEYARSITTTNLFFSKLITQDQDIVCTHILDLMKTYMKFCPKLQKKLMGIIQTHLKKPKTNELAKKTDDERGTEITTKPSPELSKDVINTAGKILKIIMDHVEISLPTPNIAQDKAQYSEMNDYIEMVSRFLDIVFAQELMPSDNMQATNTLNIIKANIKREVVNNFMSRVGIIKTVTIPTLEDFIAKYKIADDLQALLNLDKELKETSTRLSGGDQNMMGGGMDMGGMGMDMNQDMGMMGESGMSEEPSPMDMGGNPPEPQPDFVSPEVPASEEEENNSGGEFNPTGM